MKFNYPVPSHFQFSGRDGSGTGIPSDPGPQPLPCQVKKSSKPPTLVQGPGKDELVALEDGHGYLVHNDVGWMGPPGKDELLIWILSET